MATKDPEKRKAAQHRYRAKRHAEKFGPDAGDMRGRHGNHARGPANAKWNDGLSKHEEGYIKVRVGGGHPEADPNGYAYLHLLVWLAAGRPHPGPHELIHHVNETKTDNRVENLELLTRSTHAVHHNASRDRNAEGRWLPGNATGEG